MADGRRGPEAGPAPYDRFAGQLADARRTGLRISAPTGRLPGDRFEAAMVQRQTIARSGEPVAGWKVALHPDHGPVAAPIGHAAEAVDGVAAFDFASAEALEVEIAFRLARDLVPLKGRPHTEDTILDHVASIHIGVEFIAHRLRPRDRSSFPLFLADRLGNGGYVLGPAIGRPLARALAGGPREGAGSIRLAFDGGTASVFDARHPDGNPFTPLLAFLNAPEGEAQDNGFWRFCAGQFVTTGSFCGAVPFMECSSVSVDWLGSLSIGLQIAEPAAIIS